MATVKLVSQSVAMLFWFIKDFIEGRNALFVEMARLSPEQRAMIRMSYTYMETAATRNGLGLFMR